MPRGKKAQLDRPLKTTVHLRESIKSRVELALYSELEGRIPYGAVSDLINSLLNMWLNAKQLDLAPYGVDGMVTGPQHTIEALQNALIKYQKEEHKC